MFFFLKIIRTLSVAFKSLRNISMLRSSLYVKNLFFCEFSWKGGGTFPLNIYKSSRDQWEATLLSRNRSGQILARSIGTDKQTHRETNRHTERQTDILLLYYKDKGGRHCKLYWFLKVLLYSLAQFKKKIWMYKLALSTFHKFF